MTRHLTEDELEDVLLGEGPAAAEAHLAECEDCRRKSDAFMTAMGAFNEASLAWSEARSHTMTREVAGRKAEGFRVPAPAWGLSAMLVFASLMVWSKSAERHDRAPAAAAISAAGPDSATQIAADNAMLAGIDSALEQPDPSPLVSYSPTGRQAAGGR